MIYHVKKRNKQGNCNTVRFPPHLKTRSENWILLPLCAIGWWHV